MPDAQPTGADSTTPDGIAARNLALKLPTIVEKALLARPVKLHGLTLHGFSFDAMLVLHHIGNTLGRDLSEKGLAGMSHLEIAQAIFTLAAPESAIELASPPNGDSALSEFDRAALTFLRTHGIMPWMIQDIALAIGRLIAEGLAAAPGAGAENPPKGAA